MPSHRSEYGQFFTPAEFARDFVCESIRCLVTHGDPDIRDKGPRRMKVLDPACGEGELLIQYMESLNVIYDKMDIVHTLYGMDRDPDVAARCRSRIKEYVLKKSRIPASEQRWEYPNGRYEPSIDPDEIIAKYAKKLDEVLERNIQVGDSLFFDWDRPEGDEWRDEIVDGVDLVLMNPPYLGGGKISSALGADYVTRLKAFPTYHGRTDLCAYFLVHGYTHLKPGGIMSSITTASICEGDTRRTALCPILSYGGGRIVAADRNVKWPGDANVSVALVHILKKLGEETETETDTPACCQRSHAENQLGEQMRLFAEAAYT